jgi:undecaprenyl-diphosphatase
MPTLSFQANRRVKNRIVRTAINLFSVLFSLFMVIGRTVAGVHWLTDIIGSVLLSAGLFLIYKGVVLFVDSRTNSRSEESQWNWAKSCRS